MHLGSKQLIRILTDEACLKAIWNLHRVTKRPGSIVTAIIKKGITPHLGAVHLTAISEKLVNCDWQFSVLPIHFNTLSGAHLPPLASVVNG